MPLGPSMPFLPQCYDPVAMPLAVLLNVEVAVKEGKDLAMSCSEGGVPDVETFEHLLSHMDLGNLF